MHHGEPSTFKSCSSVFSARQIDKSIQTCNSKCSRPSPPPTSCASHVQQANAETAERRGGIELRARLPICISKIDEIRNATGPLNLLHTYPICVYSLLRLNDFRVCAPVFFDVKFSEYDRSSQLNQLRNASSCLPEFHNEAWGEGRFFQAEENTEQERPET